MKTKIKLIDNFLLREIIMTLFEIAEANTAAIANLQITVAAIPSPVDQSAAIAAVKSEADATQTQLTALAALVGTPAVVP